jgi:hypothetical protein
VPDDLVPECPVPAVVPLDDRVLGPGPLRHLGDQRPALGHPLGPATVEQAHVRVAEQGAHPQRVRGPPVVPVAVQDESGVPADPLLRHEGGEAGAVDVVAGLRVVQLGMPVELHGAGDVAGLVQQDILVGLGDDKPRVIQVLGQPPGGHQHLRAGVLTELRVGIVWQCHD